MTDAEVEVVGTESGQLSEDKNRRFFGRVRGRTRGKLKRLRKLFPNKAKERLEAPVNELLSLVCDLGCLSFRAYNDPSNPGIDELTTTGCRVKHLNHSILNDSVEGALKIHLQRARNVLDADFGPGRSDPYVVFYTGWSQVASKTVKNEDNPVWNSTHYLLLRKPGAVRRDDENLTIRLFDSDAAWGDNAERQFRQFLIRDDFLGSAAVNLAELKKPGVHKREVTLHLEGDHREQKTVVMFSVEHLTFAEICEELGKKEGSDAWSKKVEDTGDYKWTELPVDSHVGHITFQPVTYINCMRTGTQVWIHANKQEKAIAVAFRGTEANRLKDLVTDLSFFPVRLKWKNDDSCTLHLSENVMHHRIRVHTGFRSAYQSVWSTILTIVENIMQWNKDWTICVTGHSLGGALATLCAFEYANRQNAAGETPHIVMMNFGAPRLGNKQFVRHYHSSVPESYRVVNCLDIIHKIPMFLKHVPREISFEDDGTVIVDKRQAIEVETIDRGLDEEDLVTNQEEKKLTKKALFKTPGFRGHFENYYFSVVTRAIMSLFKDQKEQLHYLIGGLTHVEEEEETPEQPQQHKASSSTPPQNKPPSEIVAERPASAAKTSS